MRIFIALLFPDEIKDQIYDYLEDVEENSESGNFTYFDNLHLTVLYIGETSKEQLAKIKNKLQEIKFDSFIYKTDEIGLFKRNKSRKIVYLGVERNYDIFNLYNLVCVKLKEIGLDFTSGKYTPHITLGREVALSNESDIDTILTPSLKIKADRLSIMESKRIDGILTYKEIDYIPFN